MRPLRIGLCGLLLLASPRAMSAVPVGLRSSTVKPATQYINNLPPPPQPPPPPPSVMDGQKDQLIERDVVRRVIYLHIKQIRNCYQQALFKNPKLAGRLVGQWGEPRQCLPRQSRRRGSPGLWRNARRLRGGAGDPGDEGARVARHLLSLP
ncbi:MAG TPA: hypothetical protein PKL17_11575, partial [Pseudomonadota bacterium]|nr:hypothetical protein [Pseudomonadota bacterium]